MPASRVLPWRRGIAAPAVETAPLIATFHSRHPKAPTDRILRAYEVAARAHEGQQRRSGEPYVQHPLAVAEIVARLGLDDITITAALMLPEPNGEQPRGVFAMDFPLNKASASLTAQLEGRWRVREPLPHLAVQADGSPEDLVERIEAIERRGLLASSRPVDAEPV